MNKEELKKEDKLINILKDIMRFDFSMQCDCSSCKLIRFNIKELLNSLGEGKNG